MDPVRGDARFRASFEQLKVRDLRAAGLCTRPPRDLLLRLVEPLLTLLGRHLAQFLATLDPNRGDLDRLDG
jgi:hypothetical protein